jgi:hypothetical protein
MAALQSPPLATPAAPGTPPALRVRRPGWRDPRLVAGVVLVAASVLLGARLLAAADDTVAVWAARHDLAAGTTVEREDLTPVRVHLSDRATDRYLSVGSAPAPGSTLAHDVGEGELLARSAVVADPGPALVEVPLSVAPDDLPASVRRGVVVDVWVIPHRDSAEVEHARARPAFEGVVVVAVPSATDSLAPRTTQQVIVGVPADQVDRLADALGLLADGRVVLTRRAGA